MLPMEELFFKMLYAMFS